MIEIVLVVLAVVSLFILSTFFKTVKCHDGRVDGKTVLITGMHSTLFIETETIYWQETSKLQFILFLLQKSQTFNLNAILCNNKTW